MLWKVVKAFMCNQCKPHTFMHPGVFIYVPTQELCWHCSRLIMLHRWSARAPPNKETFSRRPPLALQARNTNTKRPVLRNWSPSLQPGQGNSVWLLGKTAATTCPSWASSSIFALRMSSARASQAGKSMKSPFLGHHGVISDAAKRLLIWIAVPPGCKAYTHFEIEMYPSLRPHSGNFKDHHLATVYRASSEEHEVRKQSQ